MGIISIEKADHLFWLGRYTERVFTTLGSFFECFDKMLDVDAQAYTEFCEKLNIPMIYENMNDFIAQYVFSAKDPNSIYSNLLRAYDNGVVLRGELTSKSLSYLEICLDRLKHNDSNKGLVYQLQPVEDFLYAFWGCLDDQVEDEECRNIIKCGRYLERLDLYMRLGYSYRAIEKEYQKFVKRLEKVRIGYNLSEADRLAEIINTGENWESRRLDALNILWNIF